MTFIRINETMKNDIVLDMTESLRVKVRESQIILFVFISVPHFSLFYLLKSLKFR
jgi:hypothetical protein